MSITEQAMCSMDSPDACVRHITEGTEPLLPGSMSGALALASTCHYSAVGQALMMPDSPIVEATFAANQKQQHYLVK